MTQQYVSEDWRRPVFQALPAAFPSIPGIAASPLDTIPIPRFIIEGDIDGKPQAEVAHGEDARTPHLRDTLFRSALVPDPKRGMP